MIWFHTPNKVVDILRKHNISPDRAFGQNFLINETAMKSIIRAADIKNSDTVVEIGPGLGVLTKNLAAQAKTVVAIEADERLLPALKETIKGAQNVDILLKDALKFDFNTLPPRSCFVSNLPYNVANPILRSALNSGKFKMAVVLIQSEVADRLVAEPGTKAYGALTIFCRYFARIRKIRDVSAGCFLPKPKVQSTILRFDMHEDITADPDLFKLVQQAFRHRRKTLIGNLIKAGYKKTILLEALQKTGTNQLSRAEELSLNEFQSLQQALKS